MDYDPRGACVCGSTGRCWAGAGPAAGAKA